MIEECEVKNEVAFNYLDDKGAIGELLNVYYENLDKKMLGMEKTYFPHDEQYLSKARNNEWIRLLKAKVVKFNYERIHTIVRDGGLKEPSHIPGAALLTLRILEEDLNTSIVWDIRDVIYRSSEWDISPEALDRFENMETEVCLIRWDSSNYGFAMFPTFKNLLFVGDFGRQYLLEHLIKSPQ